MSVDLDDIAEALGLLREIEHSILHDKKSVLWVMIRTAKEGAAEAMRALVDADPLNTGDIMRLQNEVKRYRDLIRWLRQMVAHGKDNLHHVAPTDEEKRAMWEKINSPEEEVTDA